MDAQIAGSHIAAHDAHPLDSSTSLWHTVAHDTPALAAPHSLHMDIHECKHRHMGTHMRLQLSHHSPNPRACSSLPYQHDTATINPHCHPRSFPIGKILGKILDKSEFITGIILSNHVGELFKRDSKHRDQSKSILRLQLYWLHLMDKIFSVFKSCSPISIPPPRDEHADTGTTKATSPPYRSSVPTQYRDSRSRVDTHLYSSLHYLFSGANTPSTLSSVCRHLGTIISSSAVRYRCIFVDFLAIIAYASSFPFHPSIHVHHFSSAPRFGVHATSPSARSNMTLSTLAKLTKPRNSSIFLEVAFIKK